MKEIMGKMVCETIEEIADPKHTALMVIDIQNDHGPQGVLARHGRDVSWAMSIVPSVKKVLAEARKRGMLVIFTSNTVSRNYRAESAPLLRMMDKFKHRLNGDEGYELEGTWGNEPLEEFGRRPEEPWIAKYRSSAFHGTGLEHLLKNSGIATAVVTGLVTEGCVDSTSRDLLGHGYYPVLLRDCLTSSRRDLHEAALTIQSARYDVITSDQLLQAWARRES
ncbi:MAG: cysteine hydrolase [Betaproteobacteria bacterium]|nr:cysteine hydrolase [Betaproteobacteria bacterium]